MITVSEPIKVESIALSETEHTINVGDELTLTASVKPDDAANKDVAWLSDDTGVATVDGGVVKAIAPGTCNIQCSSTDGGNISATCRITVNEPEQKWLSVVLPNGSFAIDVTDMPEIDLKVAPDDGYAVHSITIDGKELPFELSDSIFYAFVVDSHPVYYSPVLHHTEEPRLGIARLRFRRQRPYFHKSETEIRQVIVKFSVLVKTAGQTDRIPEFQTENLPLQSRIILSEGHPGQWLRKRNISQTPEGRKSQIMRCLRIQTEQQRTYDMLIHNYR